MGEYKSIKDMTLEECIAMRDEHLEMLYGGEDEETRREREMFGPFNDTVVVLLDGDEVIDWGN